MLSGPRRHTEVQSPETAVKKTPLPMPPQTVHRLQFDDPSDGTLMRPTGITTEPVGDPPGGSGSTAEAVSDLKEKALANAKVREILGTRFTLISTTILDPGYKQLSGCCTATPTRNRLTFYSYTNNIAIDVDMKGDAVTSVLRRAYSYLPPEGEEEMREAIDLARKDNRIAGGLANLDGHAILMQPGDGLLRNEPGYGHRVFWVTFSKELSGNPEYWAVVDLSEQIVLKAEKEEAHP